MSLFKKDMKNHRLVGDWSLFEKLYERFKRDGFPSKPKIPKIIHQIWIGGSMPKKYEKYTDSIKEKNPEYEYRLWTENDINTFKMKNRKLFNECNNVGAKSDILRYEILERFGGIYLDTDFLALKSFDSLLGFDFFGGIGGQHIHKPEVFNGLIGCIPNHPVLKKCIDGLSHKSATEIMRRQYDAKMQAAMRVITFTGPQYFTQVFLNNTDEFSNSIVLPDKYFYSLPARSRKQYNENMINHYINHYTTEDSIAVHLWGCLWM